MAEAEKISPARFETARKLLERGLVALPPHMRDGARGFVMKGREVGGFLTSVFDGDFDLAARRADPRNFEAMHLWREFCGSYIPRGCNGSPEARKAWQASGGLEGRL